MYASIRWYGGNTDLAGQLASRADDVKSVISVISGFKAYYLVQRERRSRTDQRTTSGGEVVVHA